jgi:hypothetical protein
VPEHFWHVIGTLAVIGVPIVIIAAFKAYDARYEARNGPTNHPAGTRPKRRGPARLALASAGAGLVHAGVCPEHFKEATSYGVFFLLSALAQVAWAVAVYRKPPTKALLRAGVFGNLAVIVLWGVTRSVGLPVGPHPWTREGGGMAAALSVLLELYVVLAAWRYSLHELQDSVQALDHASGDCHQLAV